MYGSLLRPQLTILGFFTNDFDDNLLPVDSWMNAVTADGMAINVRKYRVDSRENIIEFDLRSIQHLTVYGKDPPLNQVEYRLGLTRLGTLALRLFDAVDELRSPEERFDRRIELTKGYLQDLRDLVSARESELLVILIPGAEDIDSPGRRYFLAVQLMEELGIAYIDPRDMLDGVADYAPPPEIHWNNSGHQKVGSLLSDCIAFVVEGGLPSDCQSFVVTGE